MRGRLGGRPEGSRPAAGPASRSPSGRSRLGRARLGLAARVSEFKLVGTRTRPPGPPASRLPARGGRPAGRPSTSGRTQRSAVRRWRLGATQCFRIRTGALPFQIQVAVEPLWRVWPGVRVTIDALGQTLEGAHARSLFLCIAQSESGRFLHFFNMGDTKATKHHHATGGVSKWYMQAKEAFGKGSLR